MTRTRNNFGMERERIVPKSEMRKLRREDSLCYTSPVCTALYQLKKKGVLAMDIPRIVFLLLLMVFANLTGWNACLWDRYKSPVVRDMLKGTLETAEPYRSYTIIWALFSVTVLFIAAII